MGVQTDGQDSRAKPYLSLRFVVYYYQATGGRGGEGPGNYEMIDGKRHYEMMLFMPASISEWGEKVCVLRGIMLANGHEHWV